jgi:hypothetical protein
MGEGIQIKKGDEGNGIQVWGTSNNPGDWQGAGVDTNCCPCDCGCPEFESCLRQGEILKATITSPCEDLNGLVKYLIVGEGDTHEGNGCWTFMQDSGYGYGDCLILNPGEPNLPSLICCDNDREFCPDAQGCMRYYLVLRAYECNSEPQIVCATSCSCGESGKGFFLEFADIPLDGFPQLGSGDPPTTYYLCGCDCEWPTTITIRVERLLECCCTNLEDPADPTLLATVNGPDGDPCPGTMEGADATLTHDDSVCRIWNSASNLSFNCGDGVTYELELEMTCPQVEEGEGTVSGGCCDDFQLKVTCVSCTDCDTDYAEQTAGVVNDCTCLPLNLKFGPYRLWHADGDTGCECSEEFYITVVESP